MSIDSTTEYQKQSRCAREQAHFPGDIFPRPVFPVLYSPCDTFHACRFPQGPFPKEPTFPTSLFPRAVTSPDDICHIMGEFIRSTICTVSLFSFCFKFWSKICDKLVIIIYMILFVFFVVTLKQTIILQPNYYVIVCDTAIREITVFGLIAWTGVNGFWPKLLNVMKLDHAWMTNVLKRDLG